MPQYVRDPKTGQVMTQEELDARHQAEYQQYMQQNPQDPEIAEQAAEYRKNPTGMNESQFNFNNKVAIDPEKARQIGQSMAGQAVDPNEEAKRQALLKLINR